MGGVWLTLALIAAGVVGAAQGEPWLEGSPIPWKGLSPVFFQWGEGTGPGIEDEEGLDDETPSPGGMSIMHAGGERAEIVTEEVEPQKRISIALFLNLAVPIGGTIGGGSGAPSYGDAFGVGLGGAASGGYRIVPGFEGRVGLGVIRFPSSSFTISSTTGPKENELTAYSVFWIALGPRLYFLLDRPSGKWFELNPKKGYEGFCPYAGLQFGLTITGSVDWPTPDPEWPFWDSGISSFFEIYVGAEHRFTDMFGAFAEIGLTVLGPPSPASFGTYSGMNEAGSMTALRISIGALVAF